MEKKEFPYRKEGQFSYKTDRDIQQEVGKLYKGTIEDNGTLKEENRLNIKLTLMKKL